MYSEARKAAFEAGLRHWQRTFLPLHFELIAYARYGYQPRSGQTEGPTVPRQFLARDGTLKWGKWRQNPKYFWRKYREKGHMRPDVFSGESKRVAENPANFKVSDRGMTSRGVITGLPRHFFQYHKGGMVTRKLYGVTQTFFVAKQPDKKGELETLTNAEIAEMVAVARRRFDAYFASRSAASAA